MEDERDLDRDLGKRSELFVPSCAALISARETGFTVDKVAQPVLLGADAGVLVLDGAMEVLGFFACQSTRNKHQTFMPMQQRATLKLPSKCYLV